MKKFSVAMLFLLITSVLFAQNAQELRLGSIVSGTIRPGSDIWYSVKSAETGFLVIETSGSTDTYMEIYDAQRNILMEDDDGGEEYNARVEIFAPSGATYLVKVRGFDSDESGPFRILASHMSISQPTELHFGVIQFKNLSSGENHLYSILTAENGIITVETTGDVDTFMDAYDSSYSLIASDDDSGENYNSRIEIFAESNQTYYFKVKGYSSDDTGLYNINAIYESISGDENTQRSNAVALKLGEGIYVFFRTSNQSCWYSYELTRNANFVIQTRGSMDTILYLYDSRGNLITEDDDSGENYNALISTRLNPGTYFIEVKGYEGERGRCTLHAEIR